VELHPRLTVIGGLDPVVTGAVRALLGALAAGDLPDAARTIRPTWSTTSGSFTRVSATSSRARVASITSWAAAWSASTPGGVASPAGPSSRPPSPVT